MVHGDKRGRKLGFPTANIALPPGANLPPDGVYSCLVRVADGPSVHGATTSVGNNPTFDDVKDRRVESYIHDFDDVIYGQQLKVCFLSKLRNMRRFSGLEDLVAQTIRDLEQSRALLEHIDVREVRL